MELLKLVKESQEMAPDQTVLLTLENVLKDIHMLLKKQVELSSEEADKINQYCHGLYRIAVEFDFPIDNLENAILDIVVVLRHSLKSE